MICLIQRVQKASVNINNSTVATIGQGLLIFLGIHSRDSESEADWLARKCTRLRIFPDHVGQMNVSVCDFDADILLVSQFTLYGNAKEGHRPSFTDAARPEVAEPLYEYFKNKLTRELGRAVSSGHFGASMQVSLINDGPVTIWLERTPE
ncbi:MAG: D-aminoacyl-tRNA deacylase [Bacteroidetes bacterium]|nr:D-aminoacyl-tRNA deacylase [Bacteroidota bacterium]